MARYRVRLTKGMADLLSDPGVTRDLTERAERVLDAARAAAPVVTGAYRDSLAVIPYTADEYRTPRTAVAVGSTAPHALAVEARHGVLARALDAGT